MRGYNSLKQYIQDYKLFLAADRIDPGKKGETITSYLKKEIDSKLKNSSKGFKKMLKGKKYTKEDLKLIATHDNIGEIVELKDFIRVCYKESYVSPYYKRILSANAFKSGRLKKIYDFIPMSIKTKGELLVFIKSNRPITKQELNIIMNKICNNNWKSWINELLREDQIMIKRGCYI